MRKILLKDVFTKMIVLWLFGYEIIFPFNRFTFLYVRTRNRRCSGDEQEWREENLEILTVCCFQKGSNNLIKTLIAFGLSFSSFHVFGYFPLHFTQ